jgi:hypothetical protein
MQAGVARPSLDSGRGRPIMPPLSSRGSIFRNERLEKVGEGSHVPAFVNLPLRHLDVRESSLPLAHGVTVAQMILVHPV